MATGPWSVRIDEDLKEKIAKDMAAAGMGGNDFVEAMYQAYTMSIIKSNQPAMSADLEELEGLTSRIVNIYANLAERIGNMDRQKEERHSAEIAKKGLTINILNERIDAQKSEFGALEAQIIATKESFSKCEVEKNNLERTLETQIALADEYKSKNNTLVGMVDGYEELKKQFDEQRNVLIAKDAEIQGITVEAGSLRKDLGRAEKKIEDMDFNHRKTVDNMKLAHDKEIDGLKQEIEKLKNTHKEALTGINDRHHEAIGALTQKLSLEKDRAVLEIREEYRAKLEDTQVQANTQVQSLLAEIRVLQQQLTETPKSTKKTK